MSWQSYTDNLVASGHIDQAALYSRAGDSLWAQTNGLQLSQEEITELAQGFDDPSQLQAKGLHAVGVKYFLLKADDRSIYGRYENTGIVCVRTKQTILIGHYSANTPAGDANIAVERLADYLIGVNY